MKFFAFPNSKFVFSLLVLTCAFAACTDPITTGSELLDDDRVSVGVDTNLNIISSTVNGDSVEVYSSSGSTVSRTLFGLVEDDFFGKSERGIYLTPELIRNGQNLLQAPLFVDQDSFEIDSMVLILPYDADTTLLYGELFGSTVEYEMFELTEQFNDDEDFYSNGELSISSLPIATGSFSVSSEARLVSDTIVDKDSVVIHHVRIPMPMEIIQKIAQADSAAYVTDSTFTNHVFAGVYIRPRTANGAFLRFNTRSVEANFNAYYHKIDNSIQAFYPFNIDRTLGKYSFDRTASLAEGLLNETSTSTQILAEGAGGLMTRVEILNADDLAGKVVNHAQLKFYVDQDIDFDYDVYPPASNILLFYRDADNRLQVIDDVAVLPASTSTANRIFFLGGNLQTDDQERFYYTANLSVHLQSIVDGDNDPVIYIGVIPSDITPNRMVMRGANDETLPMTLKVSFTEF